MFKEYRRKRLIRKLAGLYARLDAVQKLTSRIVKDIPGNLVMELIELPEEIAVIEAELKQLEGR
jgi:hypothetical protein